MGKTAQECLEQGSTNHCWSVNELNFGPGLRWDKMVRVSLVKSIVLIMKTAIWPITIHQIKSGRTLINQFVSYGQWVQQPVIGMVENLFQDQELKCFNVLQQNAIFQILTVEREKKVLTVTMMTLIRAGIHDWI